MKYTSAALELAKLELKKDDYRKIRGVQAIWNEAEETAYLTFYYDGKIDEPEMEIASDISAYIISHLTKGLLKHQIKRLDYPKPLPESSFWAYNTS